MDDQTPSSQLDLAQPRCRDIQVAPSIYIKLHENQYLDAIAGKMWEAAPFLVKQLSQHLRSQQSKSYFIIELGAGTGYVSLALAALMDSLNLDYDVYATDTTSALSLLRMNLAANNRLHLDTSLEAMESGHGRRHVKAVVLDWTCPEQSPLFSESLLSPGHFDEKWIIFSDCVYWRHLHAPLLQTLLYLMDAWSNDDVVVVVWFSYRQRSMEKESEFFLRLGVHFEMEVMGEDVDQQLVFVRCHRKATTGNAAYSETWWQLCLGRMDVFDA
jgi:hypothetical protein